MKELGEYLKQSRIKNGVSITEACEDLEFSTSQLENIESGNVRAFKDVYDLKESIKVYAKYLGLDSDKIVDEFNCFLFQHTSKISLDDIIEAQKKKNDNEKKIQSPYTKEYKKKFNYWPFVYGGIALLIFILLLYIIISNINKVPRRVDELKGFEGRNYIYEFTY